MARSLRIEYPGAWYHVMHRGAGRRKIFRTDEQRGYFLDLLADAAERFEADWHAYCLMGNHYHLLVHTPAGNLQRIMRQINGVYTQFYNRRVGSDGALFRGRYKAVVVDAEAYWLQLTRYIHRNPLEAGIVDKLSRYRWSSYRAYIGTVKRPEWLSCDYVLSAIGRRNVRARYRAYVESTGNDEVDAFYARERHGPILGDDDFKARLELQGEAIDLPELRAARTKPGLEEIAQAVAKRFGVKQEEIWTSRRGPKANNAARGATMYLCQRIGDMRLSGIADAFGLRHYASASAGIRQFEARMRQDRKLARAIKAIKLDLIS